MASEESSKQAACKPQTIGPCSVFAVDLLTTYNSRTRGWEYYWHFNIKRWAVLICGTDDKKEDCRPCKENKARRVKLLDARCCQVGEDEYKVTFAARLGRKKRRFKVVTHSSSSGTAVNDERLPRGSRELGGSEIAGRRLRTFIISRWTIL